MNNDLFSKFMPMSLAMFTKSKMLYAEYQPCQELSQFINCYWISPVVDTLEEYIYNAKDEIIIPDGCLDVIFEVNRQSNGYSCFVIGTMSRPIITSTNFSDTQIYAIRFNPTGAYPFLKSQLSNFTDLIVEFNQVSKKLEGELAKIFLAKNSISKKIKNLDKFLCSYFAEEKKANAIVMNALASIFNRKGNVEIKWLAEEQYVSERHMNRLFQQWIGIAPKEFTRIMRFQNTLKHIVFARKRNLAGLAIENGYHDQAHCINEIKTFAGVTPTQILRSYMSDFCNTCSMDSIKMESKGAICNCLINE